MSTSTKTSPLIDASPNSKESFSNEPLHSSGNNHGLSSSLNLHSDLLKASELKKAVSIFEVATDLETLLGNLLKKVEESDLEINNNIEKITKKLTDMELKIRKTENESISNINPSSLPAGSEEITIS
ncbi:uncharacterized protein ASCRUDRAFT_73228 [Ascoidea rubescens DSM 1968]|uniref:Uncharacterized protein n=1 Tax=Ascoidea rubescens DSM 1968 TaxID=1344418 RepID=A0A1D2VP59_9ASCO|nr:hypothetical protein ASCRUDRAFT_73228 [Ascoidea rubescens DSM 1968]ODV63347.1 hypothetical protein ASCRUDRAFT_73228 [Ascoidea rubescens DSM 1968]